MKTSLLLISCILISAFIFSGCEEDVLSTDFTVTLSQDFVVTEVSDTVFVKDTLVDAAAQSSDIDKYKDQIEKVTVEKVTYLLTSFNGDNTHTLKQGSLSLSEVNGANSQTITSLSNINLMNLLMNETNLTVNTTATDQLCELVKNSPHRFKLHAEGTLNKTSVAFIVRVNFYMKIKAKVV